ncbi:MAG: AAA family ATPase [Planctomycetaceae bacterium]|jgi:chromosomal replication initiator protein|nr:AAA family ATPase [Planctomycetaceae bacterium]
MPNKKQVRILPLSGRQMEYKIDGARGVFLPCATAGNGGFWIGTENKLVETVVLHLLNTNSDDDIKTDWGVVLFYGLSGTGKTHLLRGIFQAWKSSGLPKRKHVFFANASDYAREFFNSIETHTTQDFRDKYRKASLLVIDNLQELSGKEAVQTELLYNIETLIENGNLFVTSLTGFPESLVHKSGWSERLVTRLMAGLTVPLNLPGADVRELFLREVCAAFRITIDAMLLRKMAEKHNLTLPMLYGRIAQAYFDTNSENKKPTAAQIDAALRSGDKRNQVSFDAIIKQTAKHYAIKPSIIKSRSRNSRTAEARATAVYLIRTLIGINFTEIGKKLGNRDHKTISYYFNTTEKRLITDPTIRKTIREIESQLEKSEGD